MRNLKPTLLLSYLFSLFFGSYMLAMNEEIAECFDIIENRYIHPLGMLCITPSRECLAFGDNQVQIKLAKLKEVSNNLLENKINSEIVKKFFIFVIEKITTQNDISGGQMIALNDRFYKYALLINHFSNDQMTEIDEENMFLATKQRLNLMLQQEKKHEEIIHDYEIFLRWIKGSFEVDDFLN